MRLCANLETSPTRKKRLARCGFPFGWSNYCRMFASASGLFGSFQFFSQRHCGRHSRAWKNVKHVRGADQPLDTVTLLFSERI